MHAHLDADLVFSSRNNGVINEYVLIPKAPSLALPCRLLDDVYTCAGERICFFAVLLALEYDCVVRRLRCTAMLEITRTRNLGVNGGRIFFSYLPSQKRQRFAAGRLIACFFFCVRFSAYMSRVGKHARTRLQVTVAVVGPVESH